MKTRRKRGNPEKPVYVWAIDGTRVMSFDNAGDAAGHLETTPEDINNYVTAGCIWRGTYRFTRFPKSPTKKS